MSAQPNAKALLDQLFEADRRVREAEASLLASASGGTDLERALERAADEAAGLKDSAEGVARLVRLSDLCAQVQGPRMADTLLGILNHEEPQVRVAAGEALRDFAYDRYAEVARAVERLLERDAQGPALSEVPWILAEIAEPSAVPLISRCLKHRDPEVVASAIEALAEVGDPEAIPLLEPLTKDKRVVDLDEGETAFSTTLGELAREAIEELDAR
ncbi:MAG: HEAT repeat domain-containing protein [Myxococcales bacterium]